MSRPNALLAIALAALLVTAGCLGGIAGTGDGANTGDGTDSDDASVSFYVSDRPGAIDQFEHLNVTITSVGFHQADDGGDDSDEDEADDSDDDVENETTATESLEDANETATQTETNATTEAPETESDDSGNSTAAEGDDDSEDADDDDDSAAEDSEDADDDDGDSAAEDSDDSEEGWVTHEVDNRTVDLTELQGANASRLADFNVSAGEYDRVFVHVSEVEGTLENGEQVNVQLPSDKLHINKRFTAESGSNLSFVFDIMVHEAGNSGQYILRPVVSESGTGDQVEIDDVDADDEDEHGPPEDAGPQNDDDSDESDAQDDESDAQDDDEGDFELAVDGQVRAGETVTLTVTGDDGAPVANATVAVDGETVGTTDADGIIELDVPDDAEELEVTVTHDDAEAEHSWPVRGNGGQNSLAFAG